MKLLHDWQNETADWAEQTFPDSSWSTVLAHLTEEILELYGFDKPMIARFIRTIQETSAVEPPAYELGRELIDIQLLVFHAARKLDIEFEQMLSDKLNANRARKWSIVAEPAGHFKHISE